MSASLSINPHMHFGPARFMFSTGIENSYPTILGPDGKPARVDELESCGHYKYWKDDFALVRELGLEFLRYGPPYFKTHLGPGRYDWSFCDEAMNEVQRQGITPIIDLCHFGVPDWLGNFQNPDFPAHFAEYARAFAKRYPWVRFYTPVNEIFIAAMFSAKYGWWNECLQSDEAFVRALNHLCRANVGAMQAIVEEHHCPVFIQSESSEYFHPASPKALARAAFLNEMRFLALDLTYGYPIAASMYEYLLDHGFTREDYHFFRENRVIARCVMGNDYYASNEHMVLEDGTTTGSGEIFGYYVITKQYYSRYKLPVMHTETNLQSAEDAPRWLWKEWANVHRLKQDGVPILGFTWYSLNDQVDWDNALREKKGHVNPCGLTTLDRKIQPVGYAYKKLVQQWREILPTESFGLGFKEIA